MDGETAPRYERSPAEARDAMKTGSESGGAQAPRSFWDGHAERVAAFERDLKARGVRMHWATPPAYRLLWRMRIPVKPPLFQAFRPLVWTMGGFFGTAWGLSMQLFVAFASPMRTSLAPLLYGVGALVAGALFGLTMAAVTRAKARTLRLPPWERYPEAEIAEVFR